MELRVEIQEIIFMSFHNVLGLIVSIWERINMKCCQLLLEHVTMSFCGAEKNRYFLYMSNRIKQRIWITATTTTTTTMTKKFDNLFVILRWIKCWSIRRMRGIKSLFKIRIICVNFITKYDWNAAVAFEFLFIESLFVTENFMSPFKSYKIPLRIRQREGSREVYQNIINKEMLKREKMLERERER
jgi:hypothetical protein